MIASLSSFLGDCSRRRLEVKLSVVVRVHKTHIFNGSPWFGLCLGSDCSDEYPMVKVWTSRENITKVCHGAKRIMNRRTARDSYDQQLSREPLEDTTIQFVTESIQEDV